MFIFQMEKPKQTLKIKKVKRWSEDDMKKAILATVNGSSLRSAAKSFGVCESNIRRRQKMMRAGEQLVGSGRKLALSVDVEVQLAKCIGVLCNAGFSPSMPDIKDLVRDYVTAHNISTPFKENRPGKDWLRNFMDRQHLSMKKANMISAARKSTTANPFIIYDFYEVLEEVIAEKKLTPAQIWNCDESGFPTDPGKCKVISPIGETAYKITWGAGRENISTLAAVSASGRALDALIIFSGKNFQSTWKGNKSLPNTMFGVSSQGWMDTEVFLEWFNRFLVQVTERPLLLIYDGHLSHVSIALIEKAIEEDVMLLKLPPHVMDKLQPLDVCCFGPLKREWERLLNNRINVLGPRETISKGTFVDLLCSIWHTGLSPSNIIAGFRTTGIVPIDSGKYPVSRFDERLLKRYNRWVELWKPGDIVMEEMALSISTPVKLRPMLKPATEQQSVREQANGLHLPATPTLSSMATLSSTPILTPTQTQMEQYDNCVCETCTTIGPKPAPIPRKVWVPAWML